jgi:hypothetical protein
MGSLLDSTLNTRALPPEICDISEVIIREDNLIREAL